MKVIKVMKAIILLLLPLVPLSVRFLPPPNTHHRLMCLSTKWHGGRQGDRQGDQRGGRQGDQRDGRQGG